MCSVHVPDRAVCWSAGSCHPNVVPKLLFLMNDVKIKCKSTNGRFCLMNGDRRRNVYKGSREKKKLSGSPLDDVMNETVTLVEMMEEFEMKRCLKIFSNDAIMLISS